MRWSLRNFLIWAFIFLLAFIVGRQMDGSRHARPPVPRTPTIQARDCLLRHASAG